MPPPCRQVRAPAAKDHMCSEFEISCFCCGVNRPLGCGLGLSRGRRKLSESSSGTCGGPCSPKFDTANCGWQLLWPGVPGETDRFRSSTDDSSKKLQSVDTFGASSSMLGCATPQPPRVAWRAHTLDVTHHAFVFKIFFPFSVVSKIFSAVYG